MVGAQAFFNFVCEVVQERFLVRFRFSSEHGLQPLPFSVVILFHLSLEINDSKGL